MIFSFFFHVQIQLHIHVPSAAHEIPGPAREEEQQEAMKRERRRGRGSGGFPAPRGRPRVIGGFLSKVPFNSPPTGFKGQITRRRSNGRFQNFPSYVCMNTHVFSGPTGRKHEERNRPGPNASLNPSVFEHRLELRTKQTFKKNSARIRELIMFSPCDTREPGPTWSRDEIENKRTNPVTLTDGGVALDPFSFTCTKIDFFLFFL